MAASGQGLTSIGKFFVFLVILAFVGGGAYLLLNQPGSAGKVDGAAPAAGTAPAKRADAGADPATVNDAPVAELAETRTAVPALSPPQPYEMKDGTIAVELSEYAGYSGLIVANGGLDPNPDSIFAKRHGFKVKLTLSEEESWSALNSGRLAAAATTADVLAVYGRQFKVVVPAQIGFSRGADGVVVRSDLKRINALAGKVLVTSQFTEADFFIRYLAQEAGVPVRALPGLDPSPDPKAINLVYAEDAFAAGDLFRSELQNGGTRLAGCVTWAPKTTEVAAGSAGRAHVLTTNRNLLIVADVLIVNRGFAEAHPEVVAGLVDGLLAGNRMVRDTPDAHLDTIARAFGWDRAKAREELGRVHLANLPENLAFFSGAIDSAGSFGGIYQSAVLAYGRDFIKDPPDSERFLDLTALRAIEKSGAYQDQRVEIAPIRSSATAPLEGDPLLTRDIRFFFEPNSAQLDPQNAANQENLPAIKKLLQVSPGSTILLRGHVDNSLVEQFRKTGGEAFVRQMGLKATELSKNRASEIQRLLVTKFGVDRARLETVGRGWEEPASANAEENRRVEVQWFTVE
jgi:NitT/TauT family transport system substrate-binding protein